MEKEAKIALQAELSKKIGSLFSVSLKINNPIAYLHLVREKIIERGYQSFDKQDIMDELGRLQYIIGELNGEMLRIHDLLKSKG
jgi:hypothetical protein